MSQTPAGWYPDADGVIRWWDGTGWTEFTQPQGGQPAGTMPLPTVEPGQQGGGQQGWGQQGGGQQGWGQQGGGQQGWGQPGAGQQGWPAGQPAYAMPQARQRKGLSPAMWAGLGGGLLALVAVAVILVFVLGGNEDNKSPVADDTSATPTSTPSPTATPSDTSSPSPTDAPTGTGKAASAPRNASVTGFCRSFDLRGFQKALTSADAGSRMQKLQSLQAKMLTVGTPSDIPANARRGWEWFADLDPTDPTTATNLNQDDVTALGYYYGTNCY